MRLVNIMGYLEILLLAVVVSFVVVVIGWQYWRQPGTSKVSRNWPVVGMLPSLLKINVLCIHDFATKHLKSSGGTLEFKGPWLANLDFWVTADPLNVNHILTTRFSNYPKGPELKTTLDALGDGILNSDSDIWRTQRKMFQLFIGNIKFQCYMEKTLQRKVVDCLIPVLDHVYESGIEVDLQDVFQRLTFDNICILVLGYDPTTLSVELLSEAAHANAYDELEETVLLRYVLPPSWWKLKRWLQIGSERKYSKAWKAFDDFLYQRISSKRQEFISQRSSSEIQNIETNFDLLRAFMEEEEKEDKNNGDNYNKKDSDKFLRDVAFNFIGAGRDTVSSCLSWFLWLVGTNPSVETKILEEMKHNLSATCNTTNICGVFSAKQLSKLVYLHATLCETLRLYPSVPINHKTSVEEDILPSGHRVKPNTRMLIHFYAMGRMEGIWGKDCLEFKPERWISNEGGIVYVPPYKFSAFNAGPRTCLGKDMAFTQIKIIVGAILWNYRIEVMERNPISPSNSMVLHMKYGLMVRVFKRSA